MDSLTQAALGAAVCVATLGRRTPAWKAALAGAVCGTLPDLDALIDHGNVVLNVALHRSETHAFFWQTLATVPIAWPIARLAGERQRLGRWCLAIWLALVTHALLDVMTVYGTRIALPFDNRPFGVGSVFIIDPLYTLPLLAGIAAALGLRSERGHRYNRIGIAVATSYLAWSVIAQDQVGEVVRTTLDARGSGVDASRVLVTPTPFNTLLWRVVVMHDDSFEEGYRSLLDTGPTVRLERRPRDADAYRSIAHLPETRQLALFTRGFFRVARHDDLVVMTDLRMGQDPYYAFAFVIARVDASGVHAIEPRNIGGREGLDYSAYLRWLLRRTLGEDVAAPI